MKSFKKLILLSLIAVSCGLHVGEAFALKREKEPEEQEQSWYRRMWSSPVVRCLTIATVSAGVGAFVAYKYCNEISSAKQEATAYASAALKVAQDQGSLFWNGLKNGVKAFHKYGEETMKRGGEFVQAAPSKIVNFCKTVYSKLKQVSFTEKIEEEMKKSAAESLKTAPETGANIN